MRIPFTVGSAEPTGAGLVAARASLEAMTPAGFDATWRAFATFEGYDALSAHLPPILCLAFGDDLSTPPPVLDRIAEGIRAAGGHTERVDIAGTGHMGPLGRPRDVAAEMTRFFAS